MPDKNTPVLLYIPNLIDYGRLVLLLIGWYFIEYPAIFLTFYITEVVLDYFDGYYAKLYDQTSAFGAWLDVVIDNFGRGILWVHLYRAGYIITMIEWITFSFIQKLDSKDWKILFADTPFIVRHVFKNNFKTFIGISAIAVGLQGLPIILYIIQNYNAHFNWFWATFFYYLSWYAILGRGLSLYVEIWMIVKNLNIMIHSKN